MSLITRCPACATMFKVVPDQLRISDGWVRCGHCAEVFDASANLMGEQVPAATSTGAESAQAVAPIASTPIASTPPPPPPVAPPPTAPIPASKEPAPTDERHSRPSVFTDSEIDRNLYRMVADEGATDGYLLPDAEALGAASRPDVASASQSQAPSSRPAALDSSARTSQGHSRPFGDDDGSSELSDSVLDNVSFVREARRKAFWRRPAVRAVLSLVVLALLLALGAQYAYQERDRIAALEPRARPVLTQMCEWLDCKVAPLRQIESVVIDASAFSKLRGDTYRLSFTLRSTGTLALALPALELTLTDSADQPIVRRVLTPADLGAAPPVLSAGGEWSVNLPVAVQGGGRVVGYRLLAFYP